MQLVLDTPVIPESGTASVRARPTVKHHAVSITVHIVFTCVDRFVWDLFSVSAGQDGRQSA